MDEKEEVTSAGGSRESVSSSLQTQVPAPVQGQTHTNIAYMLAMRRGGKGHGVSTKERGQDKTAGAEAIDFRPTHRSIVYSTATDDKVRHTDIPSQKKSESPHADVLHLATARMAGIKEKEERFVNPPQASAKLPAKTSDMDNEKLGAKDFNGIDCDPFTEKSVATDVSVWDWKSVGDEEQGSIPYSTGLDTLATEERPGAHYVGGTFSIDQSTAEEVTLPTTPDDPEDALTPVAAHLVDTEEEEQRIQELEAQNRMFREREQNVVVAQVMDKSEILKSFFNLRDPEFRRQRLCAFGFILLAVAAIVVGIVLTRDDGTDDVPNPAPTPAPTPEPTSVELLELSEFLSDYASFDGGDTLMDQSTPQYQAAKWLSNNANLEAYSEKEKIQRYVLATLYFSTNGDNWTTSTSWLDNAAECGKWWQSLGTGLSCTDGGEVNQIFLESNNLQGSIPPELAFLSWLEMIRLRENALAGTIPAELSLLTGLRSLDVDDNSLTGTLMTELGLITKLTFLAMTKNEFSGTFPSEILLLTDLLTLRLGNKLEGTIPTVIGDLTSLGQLIMNGNELSGQIPSTVGLLNRLTDLQLFDNKLSSTFPSTLALMNSLEYLYLHENGLVGTIPAEIQNIATLKHLYLKDNLLSGTIPATLGLLIDLERMYLNANNFTSSIPSELGTLVNLERLLLGDNSLSDTIPSELGLLTKVETLFLNENALTGQIPNEFGALIDLVHLSLRHNKLTGTIPSGIHGMSNLETLWLQGNNLAGPFTCPAIVADCKISCESDNETCRVL